MLASTVKIVFAGWNLKNQPKAVIAQTPKSKHVPPLHASLKQTGKAQNNDRAQRTQTLLAAHKMADAGEPGSVSCGYHNSTPLRGKTQFEQVFGLPLGVDRKSVV